MIVEIHETFMHDCSGFPEGFARPNRFVKGEQHDVPDDIADYFKRAGWASEVGGQPVKPDPTKPVLVKPDNSNIGVSNG